MDVAASPQKYRTGNNSSQPEISPEPYTHYSDDSQTKIGKGNFLLEKVAGGPADIPGGFIRSEKVSHKRINTLKTNIADNKSEEK